MPHTEPVRDLHAFGPPVYVPENVPWQLGAVFGEVLIFGADGDLEVRTSLLNHPRQPLSTRVENVQRASVDGPTGAGYQNVIVEETFHDIFIDDVVHRVRVFESGFCFASEFEVGTRYVFVAGVIQCLTGLALRRVDNLSEIEASRR